MRFIKPKKGFRLSRNLGLLLFSTAVISGSLSTDNKAYGLEAFVKIIPDNMVVVNDKMCEIHPHVTGHIPAHMSLLFNNKTEPVKRAYGKEYWYGKHYRSRQR